LRVEGSSDRKVSIDPYSVTYLFSEREFFIDNLLVQIHWIIEMILVDRPCAMRV
jgi:hypothetical protein